MNKTTVIEGLKLKGYNVELVTKEKNGVIKTGIANASAGNVCPCVYFEDFEYFSDVEAIDKIAQIFKNCKVPESISELRFFKDFDESSLRIAVCKRGNAGTNILVRPFLDMDIYVTIRVFDEKMGSGIIKVNQSAIDYINELNGTEYTFDSIMDMARKQTAKEGYIVKPIADVLKEILMTKFFGKSEEIPEYIVEQIEATESDANLFPMYVITTKEKRYGAAAILSTRHLDAVCALTNVDKLFIMPSSIHEIIAVPDNDESYDPMALRNMVAEVNNTEVSPEEKLTDNVYVYDSNSKEVKIVC